ncbi:hypothetical protein FFF34_008270 [Inquilinus sp. KBS0705]|nr:hypothetical protein FFF34_008270 [Inquilinus sp. KBS0705]
MRTLLTETAEIDAHLHNTQQPGDALLFEARLILSPELREKVQWQQQTLALVQQYGRKQLRTQIQDVHRQLFSLPQHQSFREKIMRLFNR